MMYFFELSGSVPRLRRVKRQAVGSNQTRLSGEYNVYAPLRSALDEGPLDLQRPTEFNAPRGCAGTRKGRCRQSRPGFRAKSRMGGT